jgi:diaminopropionate ammonia-lyase
MNAVRWIKNPQARKKKQNGAIELFNEKEMENVVRFHQSFPQYQETPLVKLQNFANYLGVGGIYLKDESYRFGLNSFKVLGGSYAIGRTLASRLGEPIEQVTFEKLRSRNVKEKLGQITFATATDGNHGRGVAWTAAQLGHKAVVYMPKGSSENRLNHIRETGAEAHITDVNYDDSVRLAARHAEKFGWVLIQDTAWEGYVEVPAYIMQGYVTMALEALRQLERENGKRPTHIFVQAGVGAFAGAMLGFFNSILENKPVGVVVEPAEADCLFRTCEADDGKLHRVEGDMETIMAGLACGEPNPLGWEILSEYADFFVSLPDDVAARGMRILGNPLQGDPRVISGESGAVTTGLLSILMQDDACREFREQLGLDRHSVVLLFSTEGDTDPQMYRNIVWDCVPANRRTKEKRIL